MQLIQTISMDLAFRGITPRIYGKQDDSGAMRGVRIELFNAGAAYAISSGTTFLLRYKTAQGSIGLYDALPDGSSAFSFVAGENAVTATFVDQMFAQPGDVECELRIVDPAGVATTWKWILDVERGNVGDAAIPSDYINAFNELAASAADAAARAEAAASNIAFGELGVASIEDIVSPATFVNITSQFSARFGRIGFIDLTISTDANLAWDDFAFTISGVPHALACVAASGYAYSNAPALIHAYPLLASGSGSKIRVRVTPIADNIPSPYQLRFSLVYIIAE